MQRAASHRGRKSLWTEHHLPKFLLGSLAWVFRDNLVVGILLQDLPTQIVNYTVQMPVRLNLDATVTLPLQ